MSDTHEKSLTVMEVSQRIERLEAELGELYKLRSGRLIRDDDNEVVSGWCCCCGRNQVDVHGGMDTCEDCLKSI